jgi:hypothetical protein
LNFFQNLYPWRNHHLHSLYFFTLTFWSIIQLYILPIIQSIFYYLVEICLTEFSHQIQLIFSSYLLNILEIFGTLALTPVVHLSDNTPTVFHPLNHSLPIVEYTNLQSCFSVMLLEY